MKTKNNKLPDDTRFIATPECKSILISVICTTFLASVIIPNKQI